MLKKISIYFFALVFILGVSCEKKEASVDVSKGTFSLNLKNMHSDLKSAELEDVDAVYISIKNAAGEYIYNMEKLNLLNLNGQYLTSNIELTVGDYTVEDFLVVNDQDTVLYLSPKEGSEFASLVDYPLPYLFTVSANDTAMVTLQVLPADLGKPEDFGYAVFSFEVVDVTDIHSLDSGLVAYYPFNGNANDSSGNGYNGIEYFSSTYVNGISGLAKSFDGSNDYIKLDTTFDSSNGLTFSFWVYSKGNDGSQATGIVISKYSLANNTRSFVVSVYGSLSADSTPDNCLVGMFYKYGYANKIKDWVNSRFLCADSIPSSYDPTPFTFYNSVQLETYQWVHCVINVTSTEIQAWINDTLTMTKQREYDSYYNGVEPIYIGQSPSYDKGDNNHFCGYLDELRVYNRGLSNHEIQQLYKLRK